MFELNYIILEKMGWTYYTHTPHIAFKMLAGFNTFGKDNNGLQNRILYYFFSEERQVCFAIKEISHDPKLKKNKKYNEYEFIIVDSSKKKPNFTKINCKSNIELLYLIRKNLACDISYQRQFQINSILK